MNKKGFTLVEIISVVALLALIIIITVPIIGNTGENVKKKTLETKIENIEKAAVLYGQDNRGNFTIEKENCELCSSVTNGECRCFNEKITVRKLIDPNEDGNFKDGYIEADDNSGNIKNPINENYLKECEIQIYQKYGKKYAIYDNGEDIADSVLKEKYQKKCWYN